MPVLRLEANRPVSTALNKGTTFHRIETRAERVTTVFDDATVVATRGSDGGIVAEVAQSRSRLSGSSMRIHRENQRPYAIEFQAQHRTPLLIQGRSELEPTLDWANRQVYSLSMAEDPAKVVWGDRDLMIASGKALNVEARVREIKTDWSEGLSAVARSEQQYLSTILSRHGQELGWVRWHAKPKVLAWHFPGLTSGYLDNESLTAIGGWPFQPDMAWMNIQAFAFQDFHSRLSKTNQTQIGLASQGWLEKISVAISPTVYAQDGCTGLHWLDYTTFRPCCDEHDQCF